MEVERFYHDLAYEQTKGKVPYEFAYLEGTDLADYLHDMEIVQEYAAINRRAIADGILKGMKFSAVESFETVHNYIDVGEKILRKGAVSEYEGRLPDLRGEGQPGLELLGAPWSGTALQPERCPCVFHPFPVQKGDEGSLLLVGQPGHAGRVPDGVQGSGNADPGDRAYGGHSGAYDAGL